MDSMDERSILIVTDKGDQTTEIANYSVCKDKICIQYTNNAKVYRYPQSKVTIKQNPISLDIKDRMVYYDIIPLRNVREILDFEGTLKVFFDNNKTQLYDSTLIRFDNSENYTSQAVDLMDYWADIAQYLKAEEVETAFIKKEFDKIHAVHPESVLATYMNQKLVTPSESSPAPIIFPFRFNLSQKQALEQALTSHISIIEGPPGTGKTQTILNILANLAVMQSKSVAVVSGNNAAVQNVKDKLEKSGYGFIAASLGKQENRNSFFQSLPEYRVEAWKTDIQEEQLVERISTLTEGLNQLLMLNNRKAILEQELAAYRLEQKHFQVHNSQNDLEGMKKLFLRRQTPERIVSFLADEYFAGERASRFLHKTKLLFKYGYVQFKNVKGNRLDLITRLQTKYYESKLAELEQERNSIQFELNKESFEGLLEQHEAHSISLFTHKLYEKYRYKSPFNGNVMNYKKKFREFINHFPIVLSTTHSLRACIPEDYLFDYVIVDESSQVDLLTGVLAMSCCKRIIIVGDTKQLPQIVDEKIQDKLKDDYDVEEAYNYFKHSLLSSMLAMYGDRIPKVMLKEHYRCHPQIIGFCNSQYYDNYLIPFTTEHDTDIPMRLHYTAPGNHMRKLTSKGKEGNFNQREIDVVREELIKELQLNHFPIENIGFTTPYRLQVEEANKMLEQGIEIDTVHKYQGREKPIMILSTVLDRTRNGKIGRRFVENSCLVNVAVSRAQKQFILVTDYALFRNSRKDIGNLIRYMEYNTLHEHITQSELISVFDLLYTDYSAKLNQLQNRLMTRSKYKSESIMWRVLADLLCEEQYKNVTFSMQVYLKDLLSDTERLTDIEKEYVANCSSVDFVLYDKLNKQPLLLIEVDGFAFHRNNKDQKERDKKKNDIIEKYSLPLLRLPTTGSNEIKKIRDALDRFLKGNTKISHKE